MEPTQTPTEIDFAKLAVLIDCEAHIEISGNKRRHQYMLQVTVGNRDFRLLEWCLARFRGFICPQWYRRKPRPTSAPIKRWRVTSWQALSALEKCLPHFIIKREQAEIAIAFQKTFTTPGARHTKSELTVREEMRVRLRALTKKGPHLPPIHQHDEIPMPQGNLFPKEI
jgi:hypothetical protein